MNLSLKLYLFEKENEILQREKNCCGKVRKKPTARTDKRKNFFTVRVCRAWLAVEHGFPCILVIICKSNCTEPFHLRGFATRTQASLTFRTK
jgi:hypothetical protein